MSLYRRHRPQIVKKDKYLKASLIHMRVPYIRVILFCLDSAFSREAKSFPIKRISFRACSLHARINVFRDKTLLYLLEVSNIKFCHHLCEFYVSYIRVEN